MNHSELNKMTGETGSPLRQSGRRTGICTFILVILFFILPGLRLSAQTTLITYTVSGLPLSKVFTGLSDRYKMKFAFDAEVFSQITTSFSVKNEKPEKFFKWLANQHGLEFRLIEGTWVVTRNSGVQPLPDIPKAAQPIIPVTRYPVTGVVTDANTGEPLLYCNIVFPNNKGTITNELGFFYMETNADSVRFFITHLGYQRLDTAISTRRTDPVRIALKPFNLMVTEIDVVRQEKNTLEMSDYNSKVGFNSSQSANMPRLANDDLANMLTLIPGIGFLYGPAGGLSIRGSNPSEILITLDGIPLLETGHLFGNLSLLNAGFIRQAFVSRGGFEAEFGDRASGLIELTGKSGSRNSPFLEASANLLNGDLTASLPVTDKLVFSGAFRRSFVDYWPNYLFMKLLGETRLTNVSMLETDVLPTVRYQDINLKTTIYPAENHEINLNFIRSDDQQMLDYEIGDKTILYRNEWAREINSGYGINWLFRTGNWNHHLTAGYNDLYHFREEESGEEVSYSTSPGNSAKSKKIKKIKVVNPNREKYELDTDSNSVKEFRASFKTEIKKGIFSHQIGAGFVRNTFSFRYLADNSEKKIPVDSLKNSSEHDIYHLFVQQGIEPFDFLKFRLGLRINYNRFTENFYWQPRGGIELIPLQKLKIYYQTGQYNQFLSKIPMIDYNGNVNLVWYLPDVSDKGLLKSFHHIAGFQWEKKGFLVNGELYHKQTTGKQWLYAESYRVKNVTRIRYADLSGEELVRGFDLFAQFRHSRFTHQVGYAFSDGKENIEGINGGAWFPSLNNSRHQLQISEMFALKGWSLSLSWIYRTGQPRIMPTSGTSYLDFDRFDYFSQMDANLAKKISYPHCSLSGGVSFLNILNRLNIIEVDYFNLNSDSNSFSVTSNVSSLSFTPVFFLKFQFF